MKKVVVVSGGFDPIHSGHIFLLNEAKKLGDILIVALNDDQWLQDKKGKEFRDFLNNDIFIEKYNSAKCVCAKVEFTNTLSFKIDDIPIKIRRVWLGRNEISWASLKPMGFPSKSITFRTVTFPDPKVPNLLDSWLILNVDFQKKLKCNFEPFSEKKGPRAGSVCPA